MSTGAPLVRQATGVAIGSGAVLVEGAPGTGKSTLALELIDRGAALVGDDGVILEARAGRLIVSPHPRTRGLLEVRNLGLLPFPCRGGVPAALVIVLDPAAPRFIEGPETAEIAGIGLPLVRLWPGAPAIKAELSLRRYGLQF